MDSKRESRSHDAARARLQQRVVGLSDDDRLREALRLHDELLALQGEFRPLATTTTIATTETKEQR